MEIIQGLHRARLKTEFDKIKKDALTPHSDEDSTMKETQVERSLVSTSLLDKLKHIAVVQEKLLNPGKLVHFLLATGKN